jgi:hypothetical protein
MGRRAGLDAVEKRIEARPSIAARAHDTSNSIQKADIQFTPGEGTTRSD